MKISIVTTLYRSAPTINEFHRRAIAAAAALTDDVELVMVNDGSPDDSFDLALALHRTDPRVVVVDLARNFGHHKAMMTGLSYASGDLVFLIDSDLEEEPELLARFHERLAKGDCDVVYGIQEARRGGVINRTTGAVFYSLVKLLSDQPLPRNLVTARLMTGDYVRALVRHRDREFLIAHLWHLTGFSQTSINVRKLSLSPSTYTTRHRIEMVIKHITTTSTKLLYMILYLGVATCTVSAGTILYYLTRYFLSGRIVSGYTSVIVSIWFFGGLITLILGVLGIYIANIFSETKRRPYTVVRRVHRAERAATTTSNVIRVAEPGHRVDKGAQR